MRIGLDNALGVHPQALALRATRVELLANNIANADTPGYKAKDIDFHSVLNAATQNTQRPQVGLTSTHAQHVGRSAAPAADVESQYRVPFQPSLDGNTVDAQVEQTQFTENSLQFLASLRFVNGRLGGLLTAIRGE